ncbi:beta-galactosidase GalB [Stakelama sediminis]|uniref:Beta-galactosidase n=1 Tax=Stakelama sediminis TaxID=463200 RepID=A0A840YYS4_9SPHN|nr:beta-galactosidase GalB [Stakelama sediminis]MBB5718680.1 beta-galactosidase [Stakelama sediminis]
MSDPVFTTRRTILKGSAALTLPLSGMSFPASAEAVERDDETSLSPRIHRRLDTGWRFHKGDPKGHEGLVYDVRDSLPDTEKVDLAQSPVRLKKDASGLTILKPWILPSGNRFLNDPADRHKRPAGNVGGDIPFVRPSFNDSGWQQVNLPHDWAIAGPFLHDPDSGGMGRLPSWGVGWYRRCIDVPTSDRGKSVFLDVDGAMSYATVWLNGRIVGGWPYGYNGWRLDLTSYVRPGETNLLVIRLNNPPASARWYPGGGLYRDVWLTVVDPVHVGQWGTHLTTPLVSEGSATVDLTVTVDNDGSADADISVTTELRPVDEDGRQGDVVARITPSAKRIVARGSAVIRGSAAIAGPRLWGPLPDQTPHRYVAITTVAKSGRVVDRYVTPFGIREIRCDADTGVWVNGKQVRLHGTNNHHDLGPLGAAFNRSAARRQLEKLREMGCNALRMSHNPPDPALLDLADELGFLVLDEIFDVWQMKKTPLDFHLIFDDWYEQDLRTMLRRDRNHPSIFMWSVGNEVGEQHSGEAGAAIGRKLVAIAHQEDPTRPVTSAMNWAKPDMPFPAVFDTIGLNYQGIGVRTIPGQFAPFHEKFPDKMIFSTESAAAVSSRGEYQFPVPGTRSASVRPGVGGDPETHQVSAYELFAADFGSSADIVFSADDQHPFVAGEFVWTGWDYLGEPTPYYSSRSSYFGIIDLAGFPKDRFYLYRARWRPDLKTAHILPHWTWPGREGQVTPVQVFTAADEAELFVNGKSQGKQKRAPFQYRFRWDYVKYEPGELKVVTYKDGKPWGTEIVKTAGAPARLEASANHKTVDPRDRELVFIEARILDKDGNPVPQASNRVRFTAHGAAEVIATANGDPTSFTPFPSPERAAFNGCVLGVVRAKDAATGRFSVAVDSAGLGGALVPVTIRS